MPLHRFGRLETQAPLLVLMLIVGSCGGTGAPDGVSRPANTAPDWFVDRARETGLDFVHFNGMTGERYYPEIMAPGVAVFDYDNDGDLDVYMVQGQLLGAGKTMADAVFAPESPLTDRLFRNDLTVAPDGTRTLHFTDVTAASRIEIRTYGTGIAAADYDNDGFVDLYRTGLDAAVLLHNNGNGTFSDVTTAAGVSDRDGWSGSASFVDIDRDGWLDLYVGNDGTANQLWINQRNGTFKDTALIAGAAVNGSGNAEASMGIDAGDFDNDGDEDLFITKPGAIILANWAVPSATAAASLGRPLAGNAANITVNLIEPGTMYGDRINQLDLRFAKNLRVTGRRVMLAVDMYNSLDTTAILTYNTAYTPPTAASPTGVYRQPLTVATPRMVRFTAELSF